MTPGSSRHPNTDHDEDYNRAHWHEGESWLGIESMRAPKHGERREVLSGTRSAGSDAGYLRSKREGKVIA